MKWRKAARDVIARVHGELADGASLDERRAAVDAAYPFGSREHYPYAAWLAERRAYLARYGYDGRRGPPKPHLSPLERLMRRAGVDR